MGGDNLCQFLDWDSGFFSCRIARLTLNRLRPENIDSLETWCNENQINCLYFLADSNDAQTVRLAEDNHFRLVDIRIALERRLNALVLSDDQISQGVIRLSSPADVPALRALARSSHRDSRFYYDSNFPKPLCDQLFETWIEKSCNGYADVVLVAALPEQPVGYVSCHLQDHDTGQIGLLGVSADHRGKRFGQGLVNQSLHWFAKHGSRKVKVVTQARNDRAQRLYQRCGFVTGAVQLWYHRWFPHREATS